MVISQFYWAMGRTIFYDKTFKVLISGFLLSASSLIGLLLFYSAQAQTSNDPM
jgi:hypothetical protein